MSKSTNTPKDSLTEQSCGYINQSPFFGKCYTCYLIKQHKLLEAL